jgi:hypothetical protein
MTPPTLLLKSMTYSYYFLTCRRYRRLIRASRKITGWSYCRMT